MTEQEMVDPETEPMPLGERRANQRRFIRFDPTLSTGSIFHIITLLIAFGGAWATYQSDRATLRLEIEQIKASAMSEKVDTKNSISDIRSDVKEMQRTLNQVNLNLTEVKGELKKGKP